MLHRELTQERIQGARRINLLRFCGVSAFFVLFLVLGGLLRLPAWTGNLDLFAVYWLLTATVFWTSRRFDRVARFAMLTIALVDVPMVFFLQWATFPTSPSTSGVAGFTVGVYVLLVILAALSLENWYIWFTAGVAAAFEVLLQALERLGAGERFDLILCDLMMPSMTGMELHDAVVRVDPDQATRMIFLTGGAFTPAARTFLERVANAQIEKPFDVAELRALIHERL